MLILLDIDGVMVPANSWKRPEFHIDGFPVFTKNSVESLNYILSETKARIVLTTSHKFKYSLAEWRSIFENRGVQIDVMGRLAESILNLDRKTELLQWYAIKDPIREDFVIIDDDKMLNGLPSYLKDNLVLTSSSVGLNRELAEVVISKLKHHNNFAY